MQLILTIAAFVAVAAGLLILLAPLSETDKAIQDALKYEQKRSDMARAINRDRR